MQMTLDQANEKRLKVLTIREFIKHLGVEITPPAISYAVRTDKLDYCKIDNKTMIVLTENTLKYNPQSHPKRNQGRYVSRRNTETPA